MNLDDVKKRLARIAHANGDEFRQGPITFDADDETYSVEIVEACESHHFVSATGKSIPEMAEKLNAAIPEACKSWGYKLVD